MVVSANHYRSSPDPPVFIRGLVSKETAVLCQLGVERSVLFITNKFQGVTQANSEKKENYPSAPIRSRT